MADTIKYVAQAWVTATSYAVGAVVINSGTRYSCNTAHTSSASFATDAAKWDSLGSGDYTSLSSWEAGQQKTISSGNREIAECYAFSDTTALDISGWTTASDASIVIRAATGQGHDGTWGTGYRIVSSGGSGFGVLGILEGYVTLERISVTSTDGVATAIAATGASGVVTISGCLFKGNRDTSFGAFAIGEGVVNLINTVVLNNGNISAIYIYQDGSSAPTAYIYNCAAIAQAGLGYNRAAGTVTIKNSYGRSTGTVYSGTITCTTCAHSTSETKTGSTASVAYSTANFTNVTSTTEDLKLVSGSALINAGTDLSGDANYAFSTDFDGTTRSGTWDIGFDEYVAASSVVGPLIGGRLVGGGALMKGRLLG